MAMIKPRCGDLVKTIEGNLAMITIVHENDGQCEVAVELVGRPRDPYGVVAWIPQIQLDYIDNVYEVLNRGMDKP